MIESGPPMTIPTVPVRNRIKALGPRRRIACRSMLKVSSTSAVGSRKRDETK